MPISIPLFFVRALLTGLLFSSGLAQADCVDTVGLTPQEKDFYQRANAALKSLLRPAPIASKLWSADSMVSPGQIQSCKNDKKSGHFTVVVSRKYVWPDPAGNMADSVVTLQLAINAAHFNPKDSSYSGAYGSPSPSLSAGLKVYNVVWELTGAGYGVPAQRDTLRASLAQSLELDRMEKLVGRVLPTVAESEVLATRAPATQLLPVAPPPSQPPPPAPPQVVSTQVTASPTDGNNTVALPTEVPSAPSAIEKVKDIGNSLQKLRGLFGQ